MTEKTSRFLLILEAVLTIPACLLAILASVLFSISILKFPSDPYNRVLGVLILICLFAIFSGWWLFIAYLRGGVKNLQSQPAAWWIVVLTGAGVVAGSFISRVLPPSPEYSQIRLFRDNFNTFVYAWPLLIPLGHLAFEKFARKPS